MDLAYDHIAEQTYGNDRSSTPTPKPSTLSEQSAKPTLQTEFQETFKAFSSSAWGSRLGGLWGNVRKQGESYYEEARKEVGDLGADALKWSEGIREKAVTVGSNVGEAVAGAASGRGRSGTVKAAGTEVVDGEVDKRDMIEGKQEERAEEDQDRDRALQENESFIERFKTEAAKRLKEVQKAEDAADEALLRFGTNIRNFLKDAVSITAPEPVEGNDANEVLFESKDALTGKRVIHTSRLDAQLHVVHTTLSSFARDPETDEKEWENWKNGFDIEKKTDDIAKDLDRYSELRSAMEKLVPEKVEYKDFWTRYYFLRHVVETQEEKRREMLKASAGADDEEEIGWDDDEESDVEADDKKPSRAAVVDQKVNGSTSTLQQQNQSHTSAGDHLKPAEARRSHDEKSVADSDASYDLVSGATSRAPGSPKEAKGKASEESDEEDWE